MDSLFSYQKKLHEIKDRLEAYPEIAIRAISELHRIEISVFNLFKQLPNLGLEQDANQNNDPSRCTD